MKKNPASVLLPSPCWDAEMLKNPEQLQLLADLFKHVSDPRRLKLLVILAQGEHPVCALAKRLEVTVSAVSHQLQTLRRARLVTYRREGKECYYRLIDGHIHQLIQIACEHIRE